jgi:hypothetical protein
MTIPPHRHVVHLRLFHADLFAAYGIGGHAQVSFRIPYDVKDQHVRYTTLDGEPYVPPYGDIHHRTETLHGVSDSEVLFWMAPPFLQGNSSGVSLAIGTTLPTGRTFPDPVRLGLEGKPHEHLTFGSGTFDPRFTASAYQRSGRVWFGEAVEARLPVYESPGGYRPPTTVYWELGPSLPIGRWSIAVQYSGQYQSVGKWHGIEDEGTGLVSGGWVVRGTFRVAPRTVVSAGLYGEIFSHASSGPTVEDQTFHQGLTVSLGVTHSIP